MKRTALKPKSNKQIQRDYEWAIVKNDRAYELAEKYGTVICEYCGKPPYNSDFGFIEAHHMDHNRRNNTVDNCYLIHRFCHQYIHQKGIKVSRNIYID